MLNLAVATSETWIERAIDQIDDVLLDHAHCEKKAAGMAVRLLFRYPQHDFLQEPLSRLAREELGHFEEVLRLMAARGIAFGRQKPSAYAGKLRQRLCPHDPEHLVDMLLCCALIEARSCERFGLLAQRVPDAELAHFYTGLLAAEARHHRLYLDLASELAEPERVRTRLLELAEWESEVVASDSRIVRMHSG
jgi:tRNA-(ms[2]io[6]A)-hydroxylase